MGYRLHVVTKMPEYGSSGFNYHAQEIEDFLIEYLLKSNPDIEFYWDVLTLNEDATILEVDVEALKNLIEYMYTLPPRDNNDILIKYSNEDIASIFSAFLAEADTSYGWVRMEWF